MTPYCPRRVTLHWLTTVLWHSTPRSLPNAALTLPTTKPVLAPALAPGTGLRRLARLTWYPPPVPVLTPVHVPCHQTGGTRGICSEGRKAPAHRKHVCPSGTPDTPPVSPLLRAASLLQSTRCRVIVQGRPHQAITLGVESKIFGINNVV
ncbi:hypothetical protein TIFTF001_027121 [Ficus carica]|uniref:Uncharacterized protein n=1 Tax=Ficus carica TaxID=3494 RepID=A0AA88DMI2_FICCA|nr:hypothetical protein TIFTF001_027121 [Ficus carica]